MFSTLLIALREGLEASLIVSALLAYLSKIGRAELKRQIWLGVSAAVAASIALAGVLNFTSAKLGARGEEWFAGVTSILAVSLVTVMVFWMQRAARHLTSDLAAKIDSAIPLGGRALAFTAFLAVTREGLETALFLFTNIRAASGNHVGGTTSLVGLLLGLVVAIMLGRALYRRTLQLNLRKFFTVTGVALIIVAAGVLIHGIGELQNLGVLRIGQGFLWNLPGSDSSLATFLDGTFGIGYQITYLQALVWVIYSSLVIGRYLRRPKSSLSRPSQNLANQTINR